LITHGHIAIAGRKITSPGYIVSVDEEALIDYYYKSPYAKKTFNSRTKRVNRGVNYGVLHLEN